MSMTKLAISRIAVTLIMDTDGETMIFAVGQNGRTVKQMSGPIDRQVAIDAICNACGKIDCDKMDKCEKLQLPPANCSEFPNNSDTISRQAAIDALSTPHGILYPIRTVEELPSAQPQIIHCAECIHWKHSAVRKSYCEVFDWVNRAEDFCSFAERRTNGRD